MESHNTTTATPVAGHDKEAVAHGDKTTSSPPIQAVDKTNTALDASSCPAQANTALTTDGFKTDVLEDEEAKQQLGTDEPTAAADGVEPVDEGNDQQQQKQKQGKLRSVLGRLRKGSHEGSEAQGEGEEGGKAKLQQKAEAEAGAGAS